MVESTESVSLTGNTLCISQCLAQLWCVWVHNILRLQELQNNCAACHSGYLPQALSFYTKAVWNTWRENKHVSVCRAELSLLLSTLEGIFHLGIALCHLKALLHTSYQVTSSPYEKNRGLRKVNWFLTIIISTTQPGPQPPETSHPYPLLSPRAWKSVPSGPMLVRICQRRKERPHHFHYPLVQYPEFICPGAGFNFGTDAAWNPEETLK